jgi:tRNA threonylcarbamoyladenosine biosynthesis protein TsaE
MSDYSPPITLTASSSEAMRALGATLGAMLATGDVVLLFGDLGAGKTTFSRGLVQGLSPQTTEVVSPTFTLVQTYDVPQGTLYHYDLYRLETGDASTLTELGWEDAITYGITLVEWSERLSEEALPKDALHIHITQNGDNSRNLKFIGNTRWQQRLSELSA